MSSRGTPSRASCASIARSLRNRILSFFSLLCVAGRRALSQRKHVETSKNLRGWVGGRATTGSPFPDVASRTYNLFVEKMKRTVIVLASVD